ncbi:MAG: four helix bundle protein [Calditrichia bacterium]
MDVWQQGMLFAEYLKQITSRFPSEEKYELTKHSNRTMLSVLSNISEGASRPTPNDRKRFFVIARSSLVELDTQLELAIRFGYINSREQQKINSRLNSLFAMLTGLIRSTR